MINLFNRGSAPGRARDTLQRSGSFEPGHKKRGGRKKGSRNVISPEHKRALLEPPFASEAMGTAGTAESATLPGWRSAIRPSFMWISGADCWSCKHEEAMSAEAPGTTNEPGDRKKQPMTFELREGPDDEVQDLMNLAIERPKQFCKALCAALLTPPKGWRARARRKGLWDDGTPSKRQPRPLT